MKARVTGWWLGQEDRKHEPRVGRMTVNIEKMRSELKAGTRTFVLQVVGLLVTGFAAEAARIRFFRG